MNLPVIVTADALPDSAALMDYMNRGGVAVFLKPRVLRARVRPARGNWVPVNHGVRPHPIFDGLPSRDFMGQTYLNVCAMETLEGIQSLPIVGSLSYDWGQGRHADQNYRGPLDVWWGTDMAEVPQGKGRMLLSTLRLLENLEKDPVAEKLLYNLIRWSASVSKPE